MMFIMVCFRSDQLLLGCCGFHGDVLTVTKRLSAEMKVIKTHFSEIATF